MIKKLTSKFNKISCSEIILLVLSMMLFLSGIFVGLVPVQSFADMSNGWLTLFFLFLSCLLVYYGLFKIISTKNALLVITGLTALSLVIEYSGLVSGFPYGEFSYSKLAGPKIFDVLPISVAFAWPPLVIGSYFLFQKQDYSHLEKFFHPILFLICLDLIIDPAAVKFGLWNWRNGGIYFGVPLQNYFGWILSGIAGVWLVDKILENKVDFDLNIWIYFSILANLTFWSGFLISNFISSLI